MVVIPETNIPANTYQPNSVRWTQSIKKLEKLGEKNILEIGPNKVLSGLINRISDNFDIKSINKISDI